MPRSLAALALIISLSLSTAVSALSIGEIELNSALTQPFNADVSLTAAKPEELESLAVSLASQDSFDAYGLDRPEFLKDIKFSIRRVTANQAVLEMRGTRAVSEPFVMMLVKFAWSSGNLLREYTVLLDPPVFDKTPSGQVVQTATMSAPVSASTPDPAAETAQEAPASAPAPAAKPAATSAPALTPVPRQPAYSGESYGPISNGQSLWSIANRVRQGTDASVNQMMVALYRANPEAFMGNINNMKAGSILRMPEAEALAAVSRNEANAEVTAQHEAWRTGRTTRSASAAPAESKPAQLKLVAPSASDLEQAGDGVGSQSTASQGGGVSDAESVALREELEETQRMLAVRDQEMLALQQRIAELEDTETIDEGVVDEAPVVEEESVVELVEEAESAAEEVATPAEEVVEEPVVEAEAPEASPETVVTTSASEPSLIDTIIGFLTNLWLWIGVAVVVVVGLVFFRRKQSAPAIGTMLDDDEDEELPEAPEDRGAPKAQPLPEDFEPSDLTASMVVEESVAEEFLKKSEEEAPWETTEDISNEEIQGLEQTKQDAGVDVAPPDDFDIGLDTIGADNQEAFLGLTDDDDQEVPFEKTTELPRDDSVDYTATVGSETAINLDHSDPIAEADFHMAYGLYDQAAELLVKALEDDPDDKLLRIKLLEVYFVWENKDGFIGEARKLHEQIGNDSDPEWNKVVIMGQQICPDDELFAGAGTVGSSQIIDVQLESDDMQSASADGLDFDLGSADESSDLDMNFDAGDDNGLDFDIGSSDSPTMETPTIEAPGAEAPTMETPTLEVPGAESPTMETPTLEAPVLESDEPKEETASINLDDLDVDLGDFDDLLEEPATNEAQDSDSEDEVTESDIGLSLDGDDESTESSIENDEQVISDDDATMLAGGIDIEQMIADDTAAKSDSDETDSDELDFDLDLDEFVRSDIESDVTMDMPASDGSDDTLEQPVVDSDTVEQPGFEESSLDADSLSFSDDVFGADADDDEAHAETQAIETVEDAAGSTDSDVATKLDLARAYIEMDDPDGARSILNEVLEEGNDSEKEEAERLLSDLG